MGYRTFSQVAMSRGGPLLGGKGWDALLPRETGPRMNSKVERGTGMLWEFN